MAVVVVMVVAGCHIQVPAEGPHRKAYAILFEGIGTPVGGRAEVINDRG